MTEFNCTYKKALNVYVSPDSDKYNKLKSSYRSSSDKISASNTISVLDAQPDSEIPLTKKTPLYSDSLKTKAIINEQVQLSHSKKDVNKYFRQYALNTSDMPSEKQTEFKDNNADLDF